MTRSIIKGRINMGSGRFGQGAWKPVRLTSFATKKKHRMWLTGSTCAAPAALSIRYLRLRSDQHDK